MLNPAFVIFRLLFSDSNLLSSDRCPPSPGTVERTLYILVEAWIDLARHIIADVKLREPESHRDTFVILGKMAYFIPVIWKILRT